MEARDHDIHCSIHIKKSKDSVEFFTYYLLYKRTKEGSFFEIISASSGKRRDRRNEMHVYVGDSGLESILGVQKDRERASLDS